MGHLFKPVIMKPLPRGAEVTERNGERTARWRNVRGKLCTAEVRTTAKGERIVMEGAKYMARFKDGAGVVRTVSTGCADVAAAKAVLGEMVRRSELVKAGVISHTEDAVAENRRAPVASHIDGYVASLQARGATPKHVKSVKRRITALFTQCRFRSLKDVDRGAVEAWLLRPENLRRSARTRNTYTIAAKAFLSWAVETDRLLVNPLARLGRADEQADRRRVPRAFTPDEVQRLLDAARRRPLDEAMRFNRGWRKNQPGARLRPETREKLERLGWERALIYRTFVLTGLRLGELAAVRVCDVVLNLPQPHIVLEARHEKSRRGATIALRRDLVAELGAWIASNPGPRDRLLLDVGQSLLKVFDRDLRFAGIAKHDDRGRTACIHSLRHTFATWMSLGGVAPRVAQAAMRHASIEMTMQTYTDARMLDVVAALDRLPELPIPATLMATTGT